MTKSSNVTRFWPKLLDRVEITEPISSYVFEDGEPVRETNMEKLARNVELARSAKVEAEAELMKAETLLSRQVDAYEFEEQRRGLKCRK